MIRFHTASFFDTKRHRGSCFSIAFSQPKGFSFPSLAMLAPAMKILSLFRANKIDQKEYTRRYTKQILDKTSPLSVVQTILMKSPGGVAQDVTLLCWEHEGTFCHRNLVYSWLSKNVPETKKYRMGENH